MASSSRPRAAQDFDAVDRRLRQILEPFRSRLVVTRDQPGEITLEAPGHEGRPWGFVAGVRRGARYVAFHLMPVYGAPELLASMSPGLRGRMQGKSCFNFTTVDEPLFDELARITAASVDPYLAKVAEHAERASPRRLE